MKRPASRLESTIPLPGRVEYSEREKIRERLVKTLGDVVQFKTIADGQHQEDFRGLFDYIDGRVRQTEEQTKCQFTMRKWNNEGHLSTVITPYDPLQTEEETLLHPKIAMLIHADVVNAEDESMFAMQRNGDNLYGRGVYDMKQGLAIGLDVLQDLPVGGALIITSDEEVGGTHGAQFLAETIGVDPEFLIILDGQKSEHISFGSKGAWHAQITFNSLLNSGGHGSRHEDYSANELAMDLRNMLRVHYPWRYSHSPSGTTFNVGVMKGGVATNKIAQESQLKVDMRFASEEEKHHAKEVMKKACQQVVEQHLHEIYGANLPVDISIETTRKDGNERHSVCILRTDTNERYTVATIETLADMPVYTINSSHEHIQRFGKILEEITGEQVAVNDKDTGAHDGTSWPNTPAIVYMPKGGGAHKSEEWVSAESLVNTREAINRLLQEVLH